MCKLCFEAEHSWHPIKLKSAVDQENFCQVVEKLDLPEIKQTCTKYLSQVSTIHSSCSQIVEEALQLEQRLNEMLGNVNNLIQNQYLIEMACEEKLYRYSDPVCFEVMKVHSNYKDLYESVNCLLDKKETFSLHQNNQLVPSTGFLVSKLDCFLLLVFCLSVLVDCFLRLI